MLGTPGWRRGSPGAMKASGRRGMNPGPLPCMAPGCGPPLDMGRTPATPGKVWRC